MVRRRDSEDIAGSTEGLGRGIGRFGPVSSSALHFRPFLGRFGPNSLEGPKRLDALGRFGPNPFFHG